MFVREGVPGHPFNQREIKYRKKGRVRKEWHLFHKHFVFIPVKTVKPVVAHTDHIFHPGDFFFGKNPDGRGGLRPELPACAGTDYVLQLEDLFFFCVKTVKTELLLYPQQDDDSHGKPGSESA